MNHYPRIQAWRFDPLPKGTNYSNYMGLMPVNGKLIKTQDVWKWKFQCKWRQSFEKNRKHQGISGVCPTRKACHRRACHDQIDREVIQTLWPETLVGCGPKTESQCVGANRSSTTGFIVDLPRFHGCLIMSDTTNQLLYHYGLLTNITIYGNVYNQYTP